MSANCVYAGEHDNRLKELNGHHITPMKHFDKAMFNYSINGNKNIKTNVKSNIAWSVENKKILLKTPHGNHTTVSLQIPYNVIAPYIVNDEIKITHRTDDGVVDATWVQKIINDDGFVYLDSLPFSEIIIGGFTGTYAKTTIGVENLSAIQLGQTINTSMIDSVTVDMNDVGINVFNASGAPGSVYSPNTTLSTVNSVINGNTLSAAQLKACNNLAVDPDAKTILDEFQVVNTNTSNGAPLTLDSCNSESGWALADGLGSGLSFSSDGSKVIVTGTTNSNGFMVISKTITAKNLTAYPFGIIQFECNRSGSAYIAIGSGTSPTFVYPRWVDKSCTAITANTPASIVVPLKAPANSNSANSNPGVLSGSVAWNNTTYFRMGVHLPLYPNTTIMFSISDISADVGKPCYVEIQTPDNLAEDSSLQLQTWDSTLGTPAYTTIGDFKLNQTYSEVGTPVSANWKLLDGTKLDDVFGDGTGVIYPKGKSDATVTGSDGSSYTYTNNSTGSLYKIGLFVKLPPSDNNRTNFSKFRFRTTLYENLSAPGTTYTVNNTQLVNATYLSGSRLVGYFNNPLMYDTRYAFATNGNTTYTSWNNTSSGRIELHNSPTDADLTHINVLLPQFILANGVSLYNTSLVYTPTVTVAYSENTTLVTENPSTGDYTLNISFMPSSSYPSGELTYTTDELAVPYTGNLDMESNDDSASITYNSTDHKFKILTDSLIAGQIYSYNISMYWANQPSASFEVSGDDGQCPYKVKFTDTSTDYPISWMWDFGDGTISTDQNPTHTYNNVGVYTVALTVTNPAGSDVITQTDAISVTPTDEMRTRGIANNTWMNSVILIVAVMLIIACGMLIQIIRGGADYTMIVNYSITLMIVTLVIVAGYGLLSSLSLLI